MLNNDEKWRRAALRQLHHQVWMKTRMGFEHCLARFAAAQVDLTPCLLRGTQVWGRVRRVSLC